MPASAARALGPTDRSVRSLVSLEANASTARTLNLIAVWKKHGQSAPYKDNPFFKSPVLNRCIVVKHRLRANERDDFFDLRASATKIILPIDVTDLRAGARSFFIGQKGYQAFLEEVEQGDDAALTQDKRLLEILDELPSLDPFLMRERLSSLGIKPARCYFELTEADASSMFSFVRQEVMPLIGMSFDTEDERLAEKTAKLASKILANAGDAELEPLRQGMGMAKADFEEGIFCWKGFIYYKWTLTDLLPKVRPVAAEIAKVSSSSPTNDEERAFIEASRARLTRSIGRACQTVRVTLKIYDDAYADLTKNGQPNAFRDFLLRAPSLFYDLGERLGAVQHVVSFWRFRFPAIAKGKLPTEELVDLLTEFESSLNFENAESQVEV